MLYSNQEAFDLVVEKLVAQGEPSMQGESCVYLDSKGNRCAVGHLVPDDLISKVANVGCGWNIIYIDVPETQEIANPKFVIALQEAHDTTALNPGRYYNWRTGWVSKMRAVATTNNLDRTKLEEQATEEWQNNS